MNEKVYLKQQKMLQEYNHDDCSNDVLAIWNHLHNER